LNENAAVRVRTLRTDEDLKTVKETTQNLYSNGIKDLTTKKKFSIFIAIALKTFSTWEVWLEITIIKVNPT
jgi:hypothetical protein